MKPLIEMIMKMMLEHRQLAGVDLIVPAPPSAPKAWNHVREPAGDFGAALGIRVRGIIERDREAEPQKEIQSLFQKKANVAGAF